MRVAVKTGFATDDQTRSDLDLIEGENSLYRLFAPFAQTDGGRIRLQELMHLPINNSELLVRRRDLLQFLMEHPAPFRILNKQIDFAQHYLGLNLLPAVHTKFDARVRRWWYQIWPTESYYKLNHGILSILHVFRSFRDFIRVYDRLSPPAYLQELFREFEAFISRPGVSRLLKQSPKTFLPPELMSPADVLFRQQQKERVRAMLDVICELDALRAVAEYARQAGWSVPDYYEQPAFTIHDMGHPRIKNPIKNSVTYDLEKHIWILTGSNMGGKSTLLKTLGICAYLAHLGFPVPAKSMATSIWDGLFTTINLPDNIAGQQSHFIREVDRVKKVHTSARTNKKLIVLFDELFRGTNPSDACETSLDVIMAFAKMPHVFSIVSTHLEQLPKQLTEKAPVDFYQMGGDITPAGNIQFSYQLKPGINEIRIGRKIARNRGMLKN